MEEKMKENIYSQEDMNNAKKRSYSDGRVDGVWDLFWTTALVLVVKNIFSK